MLSSSIAAVILINMALVFYTIGVFWERHDGYIRARHLVFFFLGLACDSGGTYAMSLLTSDSASTIHGITGSMAIGLMLVHALWATFVVLRGSEAAKQRFDSFSVIVWLFWLIPMLVGMLEGMLTTSSVFNATLSVIIVLVIGACIFAFDKCSEMKKAKVLS